MKIHYILLLLLFSISSYSCDDYDGGDSGYSYTSSPDLVRSYTSSPKDVEGSNMHTSGDLQKTNTTSSEDVNRSETPSSNQDGKSIINNESPEPLTSGTTGNESWEEEATQKDNSDSAVNEHNHIILILLCIISLILSGLALFKIHQLSKESDSIDDAIKKQRKKINDLENNQNKQPRQDTRGKDSNIKELEHRIDQLEKKINKLKAEIIEDRADSHKPTIPDTPKAATISFGYFGSVIGGDGNGEPYFRDLSTSKNENAVFSANVKDNIAEFEPLSLDVLKGDDNPRKAIDFEGVRTQDAVNLTVIHKGKAERSTTNTNEWIIKNKAKIKLT